MRIEVGMPFDGHIIMNPSASDFQVIIEWFVGDDNDTQIPVQRFRENKTFTTHEIEQGEDVYFDIMGASGVTSGTFDVYIDCFLAASTPSPVIHADCNYFGNTTLIPVGVCLGGQSTGYIVNVCEDGKGYELSYPADRGGCSGTYDSKTEIHDPAHNWTHCGASTDCPYAEMVLYLDDEGECAEISEENKIVQGAVTGVCAGGARWSCSSNSSDELILDVYENADCSGDATSGRYVDIMGDCAHIECDPVTPSLGWDNGNTTGRCKALYMDGQPVYPVDVCTTNPYDDGSTTSSQFTCVDGEGYFQYFASSDCSGDPMIQELDEHVQCVGDPCDYAHIKVVSSNETGDGCTDSDSFLEHVFVVEQCSDFFGAGSRKYECDETSVVMAWYNETDCNGKETVHVLEAADECVEMVECSKVDTFPTFPPPTTTQTPDEDVCAAVYSRGDDAIAYPLDVCVEGIYH